MSILDRIEEAVDEWPNMIDPCEECRYGDLAIDAPVYAIHLADVREVKE